MALRASPTVAMISCVPGMKSPMTSSRKELMESAVVRTLAIADRTAASVIAPRDTGTDRLNVPDLTTLSLAVARAALVDLPSVIVLAAASVRVATVADVIRLSTLLPTMASAMEDNEADVERPTLMVPRATAADTEETLSDVVRLRFWTPAV